MIKITLKNAQLLEKAKILIDNKVVDKVGISKPTILDVEKGKHILQLKGLSGKSIPIEIDVSDTTLEFNYDIDLGKTAREGYFKLMSSNNTNIETNSNITNNITGNEDYMFCSKCGTKISKESAFCNKCGNKIEQVSTQIMNETVQPQNTMIDNSIKSNNGNINEKPKTTKKTNAMIIIAIIIIGLILGVGFAMFNGNSSDDVSVKIKQSYVTSDKEMRILFFDNGSCILYESGATQDETFPALYTIDKENKEIILKFDNGSTFGFEYISPTSIRLAYHIENGRKITDSILFTLDEKFIK